MSESKNPFRGPRCCECGAELSARAAKYDDSVTRLYCFNCKPIEEVKRTWQPLGRGVVSRVYVIDSAKNPFAKAAKTEHD